jgi:large subunit ribosomal protein L13
MKRTKFYNAAERKWLLIDAKDKVLGRLATRIAMILQGKNKACYTPNFLCGDRVVVINAKHIRVTGNKRKEKIYDKYTGYPSGRKEMSLENMMKRNPGKVLYLAVQGMLPRNVLARKMLRGLKVYPEEAHSQGSQAPQKIEV